MLLKQQRAGAAREKRANERAAERAAQALQEGRALVDPIIRAWLNELTSKVEELTIRLAHLEDVEQANDDLSERVGWLEEQLQEQAEERHQEWFGGAGTSDPAIFGGG